MNTEQTSPAPTVSSERLLADLEARRQTALKKIRAHSDAWKNGDPGEADSPRRHMLVDALHEGLKELGEVKRVKRQLELARRSKLVRKWLRGRVTKKQAAQILAWMHCSANEKADRSQP